jgi:hypothetical protein
MLKEMRAKYAKVQQQQHILLVVAERQLEFVVCYDKTLSLQGEHRRCLLHDLLGAATCTHSVVPQQSTATSMVYQQWAGCKSADHHWPNVYFLLTLRYITVRPVCCFLLVTAHTTMFDEKVNTADAEAIRKEWNWVSV